VLDRPLRHVDAGSRDECLDRLRAEAGLREALIVEVLPALAGVAEAARIMGWDKRRVITYLDRGAFPSPLATLASGRIWRREDVETYAASWRARRAQPSP
jgi:hypothetical protein